MESEIDNLCEVQLDVDELAAKLVQAYEQAGYTANSWEGDVGTRVYVSRLINGGRTKDKLGYVAVDSGTAIRVCFDKQRSLMASIAKSVPGVVVAS